MGISVSTSMGFENYENLKDTAKNILQKSGATAEQAQNTTNTIFSEYAELSQSAVSALRASTQITLNKSLAETLKYLKTHPNVKKKEHVLGELWQLVNSGNDDYENNPFYTDLQDFKIDDNAINIFAA